MSVVEARDAPRVVPHTGRHATDFGATLGSVKLGPLRRPLARLRP